jgi:hypothetical protein
LISDYSDYAGDYHPSDYSDYSDYARAVGGGIVPLPPLPPPAVAGPGIGSAGPVLAAWCANKRIRARVRRFRSIGVNILAKQ